jgi:GT2 family glycosyltransferase
MHAPALSAPECPISVVITVFNGRRRIGRALKHLSALPEQPEIVVVDNASTDGTADWVSERYPHVVLVRLRENHGAAGRNAGVAAARAPYVAFAEDDSWYEPGALRAAAELFDRHPELALINAHVLVGEARRPEPLHVDMVDTPVIDRRPHLPGHRILSFLEGASLVRRSAYEGVGGFDARLGIGGPEEHLAADLLAAGWDLRYVPWIRACHVPDHREPSARVRRLGLRNTLWFAWTRRPARPALRWTLHVIRSSPANKATLLGLGDALAGVPVVLRGRRLLPPEIEADMARLDGPKRRSQARRYGR